MITFLQTLFFLIITIFQARAQSPMGFSFQGVARDAAGVPLSEKTITIKAEMNTTVWSYAETHQVMTDNFGLFSIVVGEGKAISGDISAANWQPENPVSLTISLDITGKGNYTIVGVTKLKSVPYAKYAEKAGDPYWTKLPSAGRLLNSDGIYLYSEQEKAMLVTSSPSVNQAVFGGNAPISLQSNWPGIGFNHGYNMGQRSLSKGYGGYIGVDPSNGGIYIRTTTYANDGNEPVDLEERMFISPKGLVGIGTTAPTATLDVQRGTGPDGTAVFRGTQNVSHFNYSTNEDTYLRGGKASSHVYINDQSNGRVFLSNETGFVVVGSNNTFHDSKLTVFGTDDKRAIYVYSRQNTDAGSGLLVDNKGLGRAATFSSTDGTALVAVGKTQAIATNGSVLVYGDITCTGKLYENSDLRFKEKIQPLSSALSTVLKLKGVNYYFRSSQFPERRFEKSLQIGFIAQEVKEVVPEIVSEDKDGYLSVDYSKVTPLLVEAIKEQNAVIEKQQKEIEELKRQNAAMSEDFNSIKAQLQNLLNQNSTSLK
jgi:hypothetical protein